MSWCSDIPASVSSDKAHSGKPLAIFLMGPTASGKTELAMELVKHARCDIISVDSALIYRKMNIGTAKPTQQEQLAAPHRLIDILDPSETYSVSAFREDALRHMREITDAGRIPLLVGGTMMYFKALSQGIADLPKGSPALRQEIEQQGHREGWKALHEELERLDPVAARKIHPNNRQRLVRAIEVCRLSGRAMSDIWQEGSASTGSALTGQNVDTDYTNWEEVSFDGLPYNVVNFAIVPRERKDLHARIEKRFLKMLDEGFIDEVKALHQRGDLTPELPSIRCVGYRQVWDYLEGRISYEDMVAKGVAATRQLAKRQITWLRSWPKVHWLETEDTGKYAKVVGWIAQHQTPLSTP